MARRKRPEIPLEQQQPYDTLLKSLLEGQEAQILPHVLEGVIYQETYDIEVMRTILRTDRVYKVLYKGKTHILHLEFETGSDEEMAERLLQEIPFVGSGGGEVCARARGSHVCIVTSDGRSERAVTAAGY